MMRAPEKLAAAAEGLIGAPFRLHGRDAHTGLDCVGLVAESLRLSGYDVPALPYYGLRNADYAFVSDIAITAGFCSACGPIERGDLLIVHPGPAQRHLLIASSTRAFVHAHAGLRRIVSSPAPLPWPVSHRLRLLEPERS